MLQDGPEATKGLRPTPAWHAPDDFNAIVRGTGGFRMSRMAGYVLILNQLGVVLATPATLVIGLYTTR